MPFFVIPESKLNRKISSYSFSNMKVLVPAGNGKRNGFLYKVGTLEHKKGITIVFVCPSLVMSSYCCSYSKEIIATRSFS